MTKSRILEAAINQYSIYNYHGATMKKIAEEVGIKPASIYFFYKNKETLFFAAFQKILDDHFQQMKMILEDVENQPVMSIFRSFIRGSVNYHQRNTKETNAYISLVNSPPAEIKPFLHSHMQKFDLWFVEALSGCIKRDLPKISDEQANILTKQVIILMDGIFWQMILYDEAELKKHISYTLDIIEALLESAVLR